MKYYRRWLHDPLTSPISQNKVRLVFGARQVGKTVLLKNIIPEDIPIEVKWTQTPTAKHARNLETFIQLHPERASRGYVVCRAARSQQLSQHVLAIPFEEL